MTPRNQKKEGTRQEKKGGAGKDERGGARKDPCPCTLVDLETNQPAGEGDVTPYWETGEWDVTGTLPQRARRDPHYAFFARDDAVDKAFEHFANRYVCEGDCPDDKICNLKVVVLRTRSARLVRRTVPVDPDSFLGRRGVREQLRVFLQVQVYVTCECECIARPPVSHGGSGVETDFASGATGIVSFDD